MAYERAAALDNVKTLTNITDTTQDAKLDLVLQSVENTILDFLGLAEIPENLTYIVVEMAIERFNRIGSEGFDTETVEGVAVTYSDKLKNYTATLSKYRRLRTI